MSTQPHGLWCASWPKFSTSVCNKMQFMSGVQRLVPSLHQPPNVETTRKFDAFEELTQISIPPSKSCTLCLCMFRGRIPKLEVFKRTLKDVESAESSCDLCAWVLRKHKGRGFLEDFNFLDYWLQEKSENIVLEILAGRSSEAPWDDLERIASFVLVPECNVSSGEVNVGPLDSHTKSGTAWDLANFWLKQCTQTHTKCNGLGEIKWRPTRLVEIVGDSFRIRERHDVPVGVEYTTLSHCWGRKVSFMLTTRNKSTLSKLCGLNGLPKTFCDAVEITKKLGKKYIWIDSLCIIQDSKEDWQRESGQMRFIFRNSFCSIAATGASDSNTGCFVEQDLSLDQALRIPTIWHNDKPQEVKRQDYYCVDPISWWDAFQNAPLNQRAWVLQERILAPRVLHFGLSQIAWECNECFVSERYPRTLWFEQIFLSWTRPQFKALNSNDSVGFVLPIRTRCASRITLTKMLSLHKAWNDVVEHYSRTQITYDSDRIVALTGIVDLYQSKLSDFFLAGLWRRHLEQQLLWEAREGPGERYENYIAPSWSWLSLKSTTITCQSVDYQEFVGLAKPILVGRVVDAKVTSSPTGPKHTVTDGRLQCLGYLARATRSSSRKRLSVLQGADRVNRVLCDYYVDIILQISLPDELFLMPFHVSSDMHFLRGLVLECEDPERGIFKRAGVFRINDWEAQEEFWQGCSYFEQSFRSTKLKIRQKLCNNVWAYTGRFNKKVYKKSWGVRQYAITIE